MGQIEFSEVQGCEIVVGSLLIMKLDFQKRPTRSFEREMIGGGSESQELVKLLRNNTE